MDDGSSDLTNITSIIQGCNTMDADRMSRLEINPSISEIHSEYQRPLPVSPTPFIAEAPSSGSNFYSLKIIPKEIRLSIRDGQMWRIKVYTKLKSNNYREVYSYSPFFTETISDLNPKSDNSLDIQSKIINPQRKASTISLASRSLRKSKKKFSSFVSCFGTKMSTSVSKISLKSESSVCVKEKIVELEDGWFESFLKNEKREDNIFDFRVEDRDQIQIYIEKKYCPTPLSGYKFESYEVRHKVMENGEWCDWKPLKLDFGKSGDVIEQFKYEFQPCQECSDDSITFNTIHANNISENEGASFQFKVGKFRKEDFSFPDNFKHLCYPSPQFPEFRSKNSELLPYFIRKTINGVPIWEDQMQLNLNSEQKTTLMKEPCPLPSGYDRIRFYVGAYKNHNTGEITFSHPYDPNQFVHNFFPNN